MGKKLLILTLILIISFMVGCRKTQIYQEVNNFNDENRQIILTSDGSNQERNRLLREEMEFLK